MLVAEKEVLVLFGANHNEITRLQSPFYNFTELYIEGAMKHYNAKYCQVIKEFRLVK